MLLSVLIWAVSALIWDEHVAQARSTAAPAGRDGTTTINWGSIRCPAAKSLETLPTPTYGTEKGMFLVCTELVLNASPRDAYRAVFDFRAYSRWNSFVQDVALPPEVARTPDDVYVGLATRFTTTGIIPLLNTTSIEIVTVMKGSFDEGNSENPYLLATWRYDDELHGTSSRSEHPSIFVDRGDGTTLHISYETYFTGPGTLLLLPLKETLQKQFTQQALDLKAYVERTI
ncbi:hypothetical protein PG996_015403 [Apiospora saccharicola]|uniref:Coenzyme Q-binding protein COQ10 START domain-containing protein n=1 Tax=Apiospora saccharicola TaxID=335842 RepID=A0ABR1TL26_9PEZI